MSKLVPSPSDALDFGQPLSLAEMLPNQNVKYIKKFLFIVILFCIEPAFSENLNEAKIHLKGIGNLRIGMSLKELQRHYQLVADQPAIENECIFYEVNGLKNVGLMFTGASLPALKLTRIYISNTQLATISNIKIGDSLAKVKRAYREKLREEREHYNDTIRYVFVPAEPQDRKFGIVFDSDNEKVTEISVGQYPELRLAEGCS